MCVFGSAPSPPPLPPPLPPLPPPPKLPTPADPAVSQARSQQRQRLAGVGRRSTVLTSGKSKGLLGEATTAQKEILGV